MNGTAQREIKLYKCYRCAKQVYQDWLDQGTGCHSCGSKQITYAPSTFRYVIGYLLHNPRLIPIFFKENVLRWV